MSRRQRGAHRETDAPGWTLADLAAVNPQRDGSNVWCQRCGVHHPPDGIPCTDEHPRARFAVDVAKNHSAEWGEPCNGPPWTAAPAPDPGSFGELAAIQASADAAAVRLAEYVGAPHPFAPGEPTPFTETFVPSTVLAAAKRFLDAGDALGDLFGQEEVPRD